MADHLKMYTPYAANLEAAKETYRRLWSELPQFENFVVAEQVPSPFRARPCLEAVCRNHPVRLSLPRGRRCAGTKQRRSVLWPISGCSISRWLWTRSSDCRCSERKTTVNNQGGEARSFRWERPVQLISKRSRMMKPFNNCEGPAWTALGSNPNWQR